MDPAFKTLGIITAPLRDWQTRNTVMPVHKEFRLPGQRAGLSIMAVLVLALGTPPDVVSGIPSHVLTSSIRTL